MTRDAVGHCERALACFRRAVAVLGAGQRCAIVSGRSDIPVTRSALALMELPSDISAKCIASFQPSVTGFLPSVAAFRESSSSDASTAGCDIPALGRSVPRGFLRPCVDEPTPERQPAVRRAIGDRRATADLLSGHHSGRWNTAARPAVLARGTGAARPAAPVDRYATGPTAATQPQSLLSAGGAEVERAA